MVDRKILQSDWLRTLWPISQEKIFFPNIGFVQEHSKKVFIDDQIFSINLKNSVFGLFLVHFPNFWGKKIFSGKSCSVTHNFIWVSSTMPKYRKN